MFLAPHRVWNPVRVRLDAPLVLLILTILAIGITVAGVYTQPSWWQLLAVPVVLLLDGWRVEFANYVTPRRWRHVLGKQEVAVGGFVFLVLIVVAVLHIFQEALQWLSNTLF